MSHNVFLILDTSFAGDLWSVSREAHIWLIKSIQNDVAARAVWDRETEDYSPLRGVTTFDGYADRIETFYSFLGTIDAHHDEYAASEPWDAIHVLGVSLDEVRGPRIAEELGLEAVVLDAEPGGFAIKRAAQQGDPPAAASRRT
jgi:hypothetical protein